MSIYIANLLVSLLQSSTFMNFGLQFLKVERLPFDRWIVFEMCNPIVVSFKLTIFKTDKKTSSLICANLLRQIFVEDKSEGEIHKVACRHIASQGICHSPKLCTQFLLQFFAHMMILFYVINVIFF